MTSRSASDILDVSKKRKELNNKADESFNLFDYRIWLSVENSWITNLEFNLLTKFNNFKIRLKHDVI